MAGLCRPLRLEDALLISSQLIEKVERALEPYGLFLRGGFCPDPADDVPPLGGGTPAATLLLIGNAGAAMWQSFSAAAERSDGRPDPLDRWTRETVEGIAGELGAKAIFPFDGPPYLPFQRWAQKAENLVPSPLGMSIHPRFGLWHAYRAALVLAERLDMAATPKFACPCEGCVSKPCLAACPVGAFSGERFDQSACLGHLSTPEGRNCLRNGCQARGACPIGREYHYDQEQATFHMNAFFAARMDAKT